MMSSRRWLAVLALGLGSLALVVQHPSHLSITGIEVARLAAMVDNEEDHLSPEEVAARLMSDSTAYRIIDLSDSSSFAEYHLPGAERMNLSDLVGSTLSQSDTTVLYSEGGTHASQAWILLAAQGNRRVFTMRGGMAAWKAQILFPTLSPEMSPQMKEFAFRRATFFGGRSVKESVSKTPRIDAPEANKQALSRPKLQKEGESIRGTC